MTFEEFDAFTEQLFTTVREMRDTKGKEYAGPRDRFDNFNRLATRMDIPRLKVWQVYFTKHLDAIESYIRQGQTFSTESIQGRITDAIVYLTLLAGMIAEDETTIQQQQAALAGQLRILGSNTGAGSLPGLPPTTLPTLR